MSSVAALNCYFLDKNNTNNCIPLELKQLRQWVVWRFEQRRNQDKRTKIPYNPATLKRANTTAPATWGSYEMAQSVVSNGFEGLGFVVTAHDPYVGVDIDHCIDSNGNLSPLAQRLVEQLASYTEITPSNHGLRIWLKATKPGQPSKNSRLNVEIYGSGRYFTVTGNHLHGTPTTINHRQGELAALYNELFPVEAVEHRRPTPTLVTTPIRLGDSEVLDRMFAAKNGYQIMALWRGDTSAHNGDDSSADLALCSHLAFWCGRDASQMDRLFRQSGLMRKKWDSPRPSGTYGQGTIARAIKSCNAVFTPRSLDESETTPKINIPATIAAAREFVQHSDLRELAGVKRVTNLIKVADAVLDILEQRNCTTTSIPVRPVAELSGVGKSSAARLLLKLTPWLLKLESASSENTAAVYSLNPSFCVSGTVFLHEMGGGRSGGCPIYAKTPLTIHKAADPFNQGGSRDQRNRALSIVLGNPAADVVEALEAHDHPRREKIREYKQRLKERATQEKPNPALDSWLERTALEIKHEPQPVELRRMIRRYDIIENREWEEEADTLESANHWLEGVNVLVAAHVVTVTESRICLASDYTSVCNRLTKSLGPVPLRIIDALTECDGQTNGEIAKSFSLSEGSVSRACTALAQMGVIVSKRNGLSKRRYLADDWVAIIRGALPRMKTNGLRHKRAVGYAAEAYNHCVHLLKTETDPQKCLKIERRQKRAQDCLIALAEQEAPQLADNESFIELVQTVTTIVAASDMLESSVLARARLRELAGKALLTDDEYAELQSLDRTLGAGAIANYAGEVHLSGLPPTEGKPSARLSHFLE